MSLVDEEITSVGGSGFGGSVGDDGDEDGDEEEEEEEGGGGDGGSHPGRCRCSSEEEHWKKQRGFSANFGKAKQVVLHPFRSTRSKKQKVPRKSKAKGSSKVSFCIFSSSSGKMFGGGGGNNKGCYFCFKQPLTLDSPIGSQTSDPEHPNFNFEMLRAFVEKNEFYSRDCNPHLDTDVPSCSVD